MPSVELFREVYTSPSAFTFPSTRQIRITYCPCLTKLGFLIYCYSNIFFGGVFCVFWQTRGSAIRNRKSETDALQRARDEKESTGDERLLGKLGLLGRRGRPKNVGDEWIEAHRDLLPAKATRRTIQNRRYVEAAYDALDFGAHNIDDGGRFVGEDTTTEALFNFLCGNGTNKTYRMGALVEIGRIAECFGNVFAERTALGLLEHFHGSSSRVSTREMVAWLRNKRLNLTGKKAGSDENKLVQKLWAVIAAHRQTFPDERWYTIYPAVETVLKDVGAEWDAETERYVKSKAECPEN